MKDTTPQADHHAAHRNVVTFRLHQQMYALPIEAIIQIIEMVATTPVPQVSPSVRGVINVRGETVPVVDLRRHLGLPRSAPHLHTPILLTRTDKWTAGLIVDEVTDVLRLPKDRITAPTEVFPEGLGQAPVLQGLTHTAGGAVLLLDLEHLFLPEQAQVLAEAAAIDVPPPDHAEEEEKEETEPTAPAEEEPKSTRKRRSRAKAKKDADAEEEKPADEDTPDDADTPDAKEKPKSTRKRRSRAKAKKDADAEDEKSANEDTSDADAEDSKDEA